MAICEKCIKKSVCKLCDGSEIMGCIEFISLNKVIMNGQPLPDDCEILTKEAYADLCMRASKGQELSCSEIPTTTLVSLDVYNQVAKERNIAIQQLHELGYEFGQKIEPTTKNNLAQNLCDSCTNIGCEFQSGIVRTECAFYMSPHIEPDNCGNYVVMQPTVEAIPKDDYEARLRAEREKIAEDVADKMDYMGSCLNEKNIILGIITGKRETLDSLCSTCKSESCVSNGTAISKADYEARLKADMVAILEDLLMEIKHTVTMEEDASSNEDLVKRNNVMKVVQFRIDKLKENKE